MTDKKSAEIPENFKIWSKLISKTTRIQNVQIWQDSYSIGRASACSLQIKDTKISGNHCVFSRSKKADNQSIYDFFLEDLSTNGTYLNGEKIGKGNKKQIKNGDEIMLLKPGQVKDEDTIGFIFTVSEPEKLAEKAIEELKENEIKRQKIDDEYSQEMICGICLEIMYQAVTTMPCLHSVFFNMHA